MNDSRTIHSITNAEASDDALRQKFVQLAQYAAETSDGELVAAASLMADLLAVAALFREDSASGDRADELVAFCSQQALPALLGEGSEESRAKLLQQVEASWSECLSLLAPEERLANQCPSSWNEPDSTAWGGLKSFAATTDSLSENGAESDDFADEHETQRPVDLAGILASLTADNGSIVESTSSHHRPASPQRDRDAHQEKSCGTRATVDTRLSSPTTAVAETINDPEMLAAFADDAQQCLAEMEASLLALENGHAADESLRHFCRQLHTLKGASGTVGLSKLAGYLHNLESYAEKAAGGRVDVDRLLQGVDTVRAQLDACEICCDEMPGAAPTSQVAPAAVPAVSRITETVVAESGAGQNRSSPLSSLSASVAGSEGEFFVRVEASRLERLMDLLAELVMLRNRRDTSVESMRTIRGELDHCAARCRALSSAIEMPTAAVVFGGTSSIEDAERSASRTRLLSQTMDEVSKDTAELGRSLQDFVDPLSEDNSAVSHLIGQFRQELMELRRLPMSGLFQRLQRAIRDAAKVEGKQVEVVLECPGARAERAVQERLFEPLLHLVRNAVSHGVDTPDERIRTGKSAAGRITLAARSDASSLCIEVRDDGGGMNDRTLELRGRELGLLPVGESFCRSQLWNLIFQPGFSTKTSVSEISGRGVGLDVVNNWVRRLRGRIDVESVAGKGTLFRLQIPLRSAVEHAMVVRAGGQLFALPMHTIRGTSDAKLRMSGLVDSTTGTAAVPLGRILGCRGQQSGRGCQIALRDSGRITTIVPSATTDNVLIVVDAIVGVEEVVVRSLPPMLQRNELFAGVTLSGRAETVLLLDVRKVIDLCRQFQRGTPEIARGIAQDMAHPRRSKAGGRVLVVDDSVVVRRRLSKQLSAAGYDICEATNGREALAALNAGGIAAVITDIDMPVMTGVELIREMQRQKQHREIPVTILSSRDENSLPPEVCQRKSGAFLHKPVTDSLVKSLVNWLVEISAVHSSLTQI